MNKFFRNALIFLFFPVFLSSCFEIKEEIRMTSSGAGSYQLLMDFSQSQQLLALLVDASKDEKVNPFGTEGNPFHQVDSLFSMGSSQLNTITGIRNAVSIQNDNSFQYGLSFDFDNVEALNTALSEIQYNPNGKPAYEEYYVFDGKSVLTKTGKFNLKALIAQIKPDENAKDFGYELHQRVQEMYASIQYRQVLRFEKVKKYSNESAYSLSGDKTTLTFSRSLKELQEGNVNIANEIKFK